MDRSSNRTNNPPEIWNGYDNPAASNKMPSRVDLTLSELQEMAARQQQQIEQQQQMLVAKEQRVKFLKQQEQRHLQIAGENDRLRKLRERVEAQEAKLKKLRALRGEATGQANSNTSLAGELDAIKSLFHEKEKELASAVKKVEELTKQLDTLRNEKTNNGSSAPSQNTQALVELEKLRKELVMRNKLNEQQNSKLAAQCEVLQQRKEEMTNLDKKVADLQSRIKKKPSTFNASKDISQSRSHSASNVAAVEPYLKHTPNDNDDDKNSQLISKQDPKYQTLPHSLKFKEKPGSINSKDDDKMKPVDVKPRPGSAQGVLLKNNPPSYMSVMGLAAQQGVQSLYREMPPPPNTSADVPISFTEPQPSTRVSNLMSNFAPRPYGSTYSSSVLGTRTSTSSLPDSSVLATPNSSISQPKTSTPVGKDVNDGQGIASSKPSIAYSSSSQYSTYTPHLTSRPTTVPVAPSSQSTASWSNSQDQNASVTNQGSSGDSNQSLTLPATVSAPKTPMYASKSVIANTYMRKLGPEALEKYRNSMSQIYQGFTPGSVNGDSLRTDSLTTTQTTGQATAMVAPLNIHSDRLTDSRNPLSPRNRFTAPPLDKAEDDQQQQSRDMPPYNIDPVKFRPNAPRPHRRRLSSGGDSPHTEDKIHARIPTPISVPNPDDVFVERDDVDSNSLVISKPPDLIQNESMSVDPESPRKTKERSERLPLVLRRKTNLKSKNSIKSSRRVSFDPLALLLDASLEGELDLVKITAQEVADPSCPNDEGITALHNAICAGHFEIVKFLVEFGCNVNAPDSDGWTPLHCAASCNNLPMVKVLVEHGACIFATTISDHETAAEKCEEDEDGYDGCSEYLYNIQEKLGILNQGVVFAVFDYVAQNEDELGFMTQDKLTILRKGDATEQEWWWAKKEKQEGYVPRNLLGLHPRVKPTWLKD